MSQGKYKLSIELFSKLSSRQFSAHYSPDHPATKAAASGRRESPRVRPDKTQTNVQQTGHVLHLNINTFCCVWIIKIAAGRTSY